MRAPENPIFPACCTLSIHIGDLFKALFMKEQTRFIKSKLALRYLMAKSRPGYSGKVLCTECGGEGRAVLGRSGEFPMPQFPQVNIGRSAQGLTYGMCHSLCSCWQPHRILKFVFLRYIWLHSILGREQGLCLL